MLGEIFSRFCIEVTVAGHAPLPYVTSNAHSDELASKASRGNWRRTAPFIILASVPKGQQGEPPMSDTTLILRAAAFAARKHRDQRRKDAEASPYINHPLELARVLAEVGGVTDAATLCAALLHDTIEDTKTTRDELVGAFGEEIAALVAEVTDDKNLLKAERKRMQVEHAATISDKAKRVKLADKISNLTDVANSPPADWSLEPGAQTRILRLGPLRH